VLEKAIAGIVGAGAAVKFARFSRAKVGLSPLLLLKDFQKYIAKIEKAKVHELAALNEGVFRILEAESSDETRKLYVNNLEQYVMWLVKEKQREALAQWTTLFDSLTYPNAKIAIMRYAPTIMANLEDFIRAIKL
jgi:hypothetical protein